MGFLIFGNPKKVLLLSIVIFLFCSCGVIKGRISTAQNEPHIAGATFIIVRQQSISLTDRNIANLIAEKMEGFGFIQTKYKEEAHFAVVYTYSVGAGETIVSSSPDIVWGGHRVDSSTEYPRNFAIAIIDLTRTVDTNNPVILWQAELYSKGSRSDISRLYECFVEESFKQYGKTVNRKIFICPTM